MTAQPLAERPILVVDDDAKIVRLVRTYLQRDGFSVVTAADGPAALQAIETHQPALTVLGRVGAESGCGQTWFWFSLPA